MFKISIQTLQEFRSVLLQLSNENYIKPVNALSNATIGQHTRHIIELYQCLLDGYTLGDIYYDKRKRDKLIEQDLNFAIHKIQFVENTIEQPNKELHLLYEFDDVEKDIESNYFRELMYNLEHTIHHQALIKVALIKLPNIILPNSFGVAPSTLKYKSECAR